MLYHGNLDYFSDSDVASSLQNKYIKSGYLNKN